MFYTKKQPPEVFRKKRCFQKFHRKTPVLFSCEFCEIFKNNYFEKHMGVAASLHFEDHIFRFSEAGENDICLF